jgi:hypothetical protein
MEPNAITVQPVLVLNFGLERIKDGITRIVNGLPEPPNPAEASP